MKRVGVLAVVASFVGIWGYVMYLSIFVGRADPRDQLDDTEWVVAAESTCRPFRAELADLPFASELDSPADRAAILDQATAELEDLVRALRALPEPRDDEEATAVDRWLVDWEEYNRNRRAYAERFRDGLDEPFRVTDRAGEQIDEVIDEFAEKSNDMPSCATPDDVG